MFKNATIQLIWMQMQEQFEKHVESYKGDLKHDKGFLTRYASVIERMVLDDQVFDGSDTRLVYSVGLCGSHLGLMPKWEPPAWLHPTLTSFRRYRHFELVSKRGESPRLVERTCAELGADCEAAYWTKMNKHSPMA